MIVGRTIRAGAIYILLSVGSVAVAQSQPNALPTAEAFAREQAIQSASLSPDGEHLAALVSVQGGPHRLAIWTTDNFDSPPVVIGADEREEMVGVSFIKNDRLFVTTQQWTTNTGWGRIRGGYARRTRVIDLAGNVIREPDFPGRPDDRTLTAFWGLGRVVSSLPRDPHHILIEPWIRGDVFRYDTRDGSYRRERRGSDEFSSAQTDLNGQPRARTQFSFDNGAAYIAQWLINPANGRWEEHFRSYARDRDPLSIAAFTNDPDILMVRGARGQDRDAIWEYRISTRSFADEPAFAHPLFDAGGVVQSQRESEFGEIIGFTYLADRSTIYWLDPQLEAIQNGVREAMGVEMASINWTDIQSDRRVRFSAPVDEDIDIADSSQDRETMLLIRSGPGQPPEYYLMSNGRARLLGRAYPDIDPAQLGETHLIQYRARDGLVIPAFLTTPNVDRFGPGPYPTLPL